MALMALATACGCGDSTAPDELGRAQQAVSLPGGRVVISQVYGGGGNAGAAYTHDFVELFNRSSGPVSLAGWSIQYASATGTGAFGATTAQLTELPAVTLQPGQYLLVQGAAGSGSGAPLPAVDVADATPINLSGSAGKVALVRQAAGLGCNGGSSPCSAAQEATYATSSASACNAAPSAARRTPSSRAA
ncbi:lamin tail domain-containing protein [Sorangium sp. So ce1389]|uniref:lamin tail domain-containing protein n=1 Tax=Sorangium sp. So ce1389 TaxID=3133336 RepID=UPI003F6066BE